MGRIDFFTAVQKRERDGEEAKSTLADTWQYIGGSIMR